MKIITDLKLDTSQLYNYVDIKVMKFESLIISPQEEINYKHSCINRIIIRYQGKMI